MIDANGVTVYVDAVEQQRERHLEEMFHAFTSAYYASNLSGWFDEVGTATESDADATERVRKVMETLSKGQHGKKVLLKIEQP